MVALSAGTISVLDKVFIPLTPFGHSMQRFGTFMAFLVSRFDRAFLFTECTIAIVEPFDFEAFI